MWMKIKRLINISAILLLILTSHATLEASYCSVNNDFSIMGELFSEYVNPDATDQGASGDCGVKDIVDNSTSEKINLVFRAEDPNSIYTFSTNITLGENVFLEIKPGACLSIDNGVTLSVYSPENIRASDKQKIKIGAGNIIFQKEGIIFPAWYGAIGDGVNNDAPYFSEINSSMVAGSIINLMSGANYYLNTAGGVEFTKKVKLTGFDSKFTVGTTTGNNPAIKISAARSHLTGFEMVGDHTNFTNDNLSVELRRGILLATGADNTTCEYLIDTNSIVGIALESVSNCKVLYCDLTNDIIKAGDGTYNYNAAIYISGSSDNEVLGNTIRGYGNGILHGGLSYRNTIGENEFYRCDNNSIYISSGQGTNIYNNNIKETDGSAIKVRDSYHNVIGNLIDQNSWAGGIIGISVTGNGTPDADGFNGQDVELIGNQITGAFTAGINFSDQDNGYFKNPKIVSNIINITGGTGYGVQIDGRSYGAIISKVTINNATFGIYFSLDDPNTDTHNDAIVNSCNINGSTTYAIVGTEMDGSSIYGNNIYNSSEHPIYILTSDSLKISNNTIRRFYDAVVARSAITVDGEEHEIRANRIIREVFTGGFTYGVELRYNSSRVTIEENYFTGTDYGVLFLIDDPNTDTHYQNNINDNIFVDSNYGGIYAQNADGSMFNRNRMYNVGEIPIYVQDTDGGHINQNFIIDNLTPAKVSSAIQIKASGVDILSNYIEADDSGADYGIDIHGYGDPDVDGFNAYNISVKLNHIKGPWTAGIHSSVENGGYVKNPVLFSNLIEIESGGAYGIHIDGRSSEGKINDNIITGHSIGIYVNFDDPNTDEHDKLNVIRNNTNSGTNDGIILANVSNSLISENTSKNAAANRSGITLIDCTYNQVVDNLCGDDQDTPTQKYGIEEQGSSDYNNYIGNQNRGVVTFEFVITGSNSTIVTEEVVQATLTDHYTFEVGEGKYFLIDGGAANRNFSPRVTTWPKGHVIYLVNVSVANRTLTFDPLGINITVGKNDRGIFIYSGSAWVEIGSL